jgi:hypothetical protein
MRAALARRRFNMMLLGAFAGVASPAASVHPWQSFAERVTLEYPVATNRPNRHLFRRSTQAPDLDAGNTADIEMRMQDSLAAWRHTSFRLEGVLHDITSLGDPR